MTSPASNIFDYCDMVRKQFKRFSLGQEKWAADIKAHIKLLKDENRWSPSALLQISPKYETAETIAELAESDVLHENWKELNFPDKLYRHQREAIDFAKRGENYVITAGTGSGKSMGYIIPIVEKIFAARRRHPDAKGIKAIICYPMNALVNSQMQELERHGFNKHGVRYKRYTGQDDASARSEVRENPPDILLTNFMMLEYMLTRNSEAEKGILNALGECEFLVMDELHTYRGRQGADIAMLIRRLRPFLNQDFLCVGTSATMTSDEGEEEESDKLTAGFATRLFGSEVKPQSVITETLARQTNPEKNRESALSGLADEIRAGADEVLKSWESFYNSAAAVWCEFEFGIDDDKPRFKRKPPQSVQEAAMGMSKQINLPPGECEEFLREFLIKAAEKKYFAVRLHQFFSGPGEFLCTLRDKNGKRDFSVHGEKQNAAGDPFYATHFCRHCSHEFHPVWREEDAFHYRRIDEAGEEKTGDSVHFGFITPVVNNMKWSGSAEEREVALPDEWLKETPSGAIKIRPEVKKFIPQEISLNAKGEQQPDGGMQHIFLPGRFRFCPNCGDVHARAGKDANRLKSLNAEGRCSATTMLLLSLLSHEPKFRTNNGRAKTLAFSDNRQDAALQAGYFNNFIFTLKLRAGLLRALEDAGGELRHDNIAGGVMSALGFTEGEVINNPSRRREFLQNPDNTNLENLQRMRDMLREIIGYHLMLDLRRGWRHNNPNLERLNLLKMRFDGVDGLGEVDKWQDPPSFVKDMNADSRQKLAETVLIHLLEEKCVNSAYMSEDAKESIPNRVRDNLTPNWCDNVERGRFDAAKMLAVGGKPQKRREDFFARSGSASRLGQKIRPKRAWRTEETGMLTTAEYHDVLSSTLKTLRAANLVVEKKPRADLSAWQLNCECLIWALQKPEDEENYHIVLCRNIKEMLSDEVARAELADMEAREHTAQINTDKRQEYEKRFRGEENLPPLPVLVCSPTMELGIDIATLNTVYLRNVPPTPANYVQRSGRAGRAGTPALVVTYCAAQSPHDQYFFKRQRDMVAGKIHAPTLELANRDLLVSHFNAVWLQKTGVAFPQETAEILDYVGDPKNLPIRPEYQKQLQDDSIQQEVRRDIAKLITDMRAAGLVPAHAQNWLTPEYAPPDMYTALENAMNRWRSLYKAVRAQMEQMAKMVNDPTVSQRERKRAQTLWRTAFLQEETLRTEGKQDFYSYRFLASQGFLPGYNFPRLPLVAFLPSGDHRMDRLSRPRFLALSEFGPRSFIYHEGNRYCVSHATLRASEEERATPDGLRKTEMRICEECGHGYLGDTPAPDCCVCCKTPLAGLKSRPNLYEIHDFIARRKDQINAGEEERERRGYKIITAYRFNDSPKDKTAGYVKVPGNDLSLDYGQAATVWRINLGWRQRQRKKDENEQDGDGFYIDIATGEWKKAADEGEDDRNYSTRIVPYVKDDRNILIMRWTEDLTPTTATTLRHALKFGMTEIFQIEESELSVEPMPGKENCRAFLYYESAEGGAGVLTRLPEDKELLGKIAKAALRRMHYEPEAFDNITVGDLPDYQTKDACKSGCYRCLFSYHNQSDREHMDRADAPTLSILLGLANAKIDIEPPTADGSSDNWRLAAEQSGWKKPDAQTRPLPGGVVADYYYAEAQAAVFVGKALTAEQEATLEDAGIFRVLFPAHPEEWRAVFQHPEHRRMFAQ